jgi:hypothetical protein
MVYTFPLNRRPEVDMIIRSIGITPLDKLERKGVYYIELNPIESAIFEEEVNRIDNERG